MSAIKRLKTKYISLAIVLASILLTVPHAWGAISIDVKTSGDGTSASTTVTTPLFSTNSSNELLLAFVSTDYLSGSNTTVQSIAGGALTWVLVKRSNVQSGSSEIWRAYAPSPLSGVGITATLSQKVFASITVIAFAGTDSSGTNGSGAVGATATTNASRGAPTASLVTTRNNSWVFGVGNDFDNPLPRTPGSGQSLVHQAQPSVGDTYWVQMQNTPTPLSGTTVTINDTAPTGDRYNLALVEVLPASSGGGSTFGISGTISPQSSGSGALVTLSGTANATVNADTSGNYSFGGLANGSYTVTPSKAGFTFSPVSQPANVSAANVSGINFTGTAQTWSMSGTISPSAAGSGATVALSGATNGTVTADASGNFNFSALANGSYTVTPSKPGFTFSPASQPANVSGANVSGINFTGTAQTWSISGTISPSTAGSGTTVTLTGASNATTTADASGKYSFSGLVNGAYAVTPNKTGFSFIPTSANVNVSGASTTGVNFTASVTPQTWSVSGVITPTAAGSGATIALTGTASANTTADSSGNFTFTGLSNGAYTVTPSKTGFVFSPSSQPVNVNGANLSGINFTGAAQTWSILGTISPLAGGSGATVTLAGTTTASVTADSAGNYVLSGLSDGTYTVTPSKSGYTFTPANQTVIVSGANFAGVNFTDQPAQTGSVRLVQANVNGNESSASSISASFSSNNTAGNFLIVTGTAARPAGTISISDTAGNLYLPAIGPVTDSAQDVTGYIWYVPSCKGGSNTVTLTPSSARALEIHISEWAGLASNLATDQVSSMTGTGTAASSTSKVTTSDGELIFGYTFLLNTASVGSGFTGMSLVNGDLDEYQVQNTAGPIAATFTQTSGTWFALMATFRPASGSVFGPWSISGTVSPSSGAGTTLTLSGAASSTVTADASGNYSFPALQTGAYTVTPSKTGFSFSPTSQSPIVSGANVTAVNFTANAQAGSISGTISPSSAAIGATITLGGAGNASTSPDGSGNYSFAGLGPGQYSITPTKGGYLFIPPSQSVNVNGASVTNLDFTAQTAGTATLAVDATSSRALTSKATTISTASFSTNAGNELLLAFIAGDYISGTSTTVTGVTGAGLTWALVKRTNVQSGTSEIWRAFAPTSLSGVTVTATLSQSVVSSITVMSFSGADGTGSNGSGAIGATATANATTGAPSASLVTTRSNSLVLGVGNDFDNAVARTAGPGQSLVFQVLTTTGDTYWVQRQNTTTPVSGTTVAINDTAPTGDRYNLSLVEVLPAGSGGVATPPNVSMTSPAPNATVSGQTTISASASDPYNSIIGVQFLLDGSNLGAEVTSSPYTLTWDTSSLSGAHTLAGIAYNSAGLNATSAPITVTVNNSGNGAVVGSWSSPVTLPTVAVNLVLLKNNKLLFYEDGSSVTLWDYMNNAFTSIPISVNLFCSGHAVLADGRVLVVGGYSGSSNPIGIANAEIFDPGSNTWTTVPSMAYRRWYPTATTLSDGRVLVTAGWQTSNHSNAGIPEIYNPSTNSWTQLNSANNPFETYPFIYQLSDGRLIHVGGSEYATDTDVLDLNAQSWSVLDSSVVDGGSSSMYQPGKFMKAGSASDSQNTGSSSKTTFILDTTQSSPAWVQTPSMVYPRTYLNLVTLPDDSVLAVGGETDKNGGNITNAVYAAELWSPQTHVWTTMASMHTPREYHSTALLLPDGRVVVSGMGADFGSVPDEKTAEFYSPPYLFKGARPVITQAPAQIQYGTNFFVSTPDGATIASATLIRTGAVTHFFDQGTRFVPVAFQQTSGGLTVTAPANGNLAPPGYYMLFIINSNGVPSVAPIVRVGP